MSTGGTHNVLYMCVYYIIGEGGERWYGVMCCLGRVSPNPLISHRKTKGLGDVITANFQSYYSTVHEFNKMINTNTSFISSVQGESEFHSKLCCIS